MPYLVTEDGTTVIKVHGKSTVKVRGVGDNVEVYDTSAAVYNKGEVITFDILPEQLKTSPFLKEISKDEVPVVQEEPTPVVEEKKSEAPKNKGRVNVTKGPKKSSQSGSKATNE